MTQLAVPIIISLVDMETDNTSTADFLHATTRKTLPRLIHCELHEMY